VGDTGDDFIDVILGFYHVFAVLGTDERFEITNPEPGEGWRFDEAFSAWIVEQLIRHHDYYFEEFERVEDTPRSSPSGWASQNSSRQVSERFGVQSVQ